MPRAVGVTTFGGPEALQVVELPAVEAGPGEVRIRVHAAAVSPTDTHVRSGGRKAMLEKDPPPYVPGMDAAGVVDQIGPDTDTDLAVGDRVITMLMPYGSQGAYREQLVVPAAGVARAPEGSTHVEASTLPMNGLTARLGLDLLDLQPGATLAVTGAAGAYGGYTVELARADGLFVIADAAPADVDLVRSLGADIVVPRGDDVAEHILAAAPGGVDALADGSVQNEAVVPAVRDGGGFATVRGWKGNAARDITFHAVWVNAYEHDTARLDALARQVEAGLVQLRVAGAFPAEQAHETHRRLEAGGARGRFVIEF